MASVIANDVIANLVKLDGVPLSGESKLLSYVRGNESVSSGQLKIGNTIVYPNKVASVVLLGVQKVMVDGKIAFLPKLIDVSVTKFNELATALSTDSYAAVRDGNHFSESMPVSDNFMNGKYLASMQVSPAQASSLNKSLTADANPAYFGGRFDRSDLGSADLSWSSSEKQYAGWGPSVGKYANGINSGAALFYGLDVSDVLMMKYGYRMPDPTRPYSPFNWMCVTQGAYDTTPSYFKIFFLTELDLYLHSGAIDDPAILSSRFCKGSMFNKMIESFKNYSNLGVDVNAANIKNPSSVTYQQRAHQTLLQLEDMLIPGQYIYSKDFRFKLHHAFSGDLSVWKLPIENTSSTLYSYVSASSWRRNENQFIGTVFKLNSYDICVYQNPTVAVVYSDNGSSVVTITPTTVSGRRDDIQSLASDANINKVFKMFMLPGGEMIIASEGYSNSTHLPLPILRTDGDSTVYDLNSKVTQRAFDPDCLDPDLYKVQTGTTIVSPSDLCYRNDILVPNNEADKFEDKSIRQVIRRAGVASLPVGVNTYDFFNYLFTGPFMDAAIRAGYTKPLGLTGYLNYAYCTRGDRYATDPQCTATARTIKSSTALTATNKDFVNERIKKICAKGYDSRYNDLCEVIEPNNQAIASLIKVSPQFQIVAGSKAYLPYSQIYSMKQLLDEYQLTTAEYDMVFQAIGDDPSAKKVWQSKYAAVSNVGAFNSFDITKAKNGRVYEYMTTAKTQGIPVANVFVAMKTMSGIFVTAGNMDFPYTSSASSYSKNSSFFKQILVSGDIYPRSAWSGPSHLPTTPDDFEKFIRSTNDDIDVINGLYDQVSIEVRDLPQAANILVYFKTLNPAKISTFLGSKEAPTTATLTTAGSVCSHVPNICAPIATYYIDNNAFDEISNKWCDIADSGKTIDEGLAYLSESNRQRMLKSCSESYGVAKCGSGPMRYKSSMKVAPSYAQHQVESFSHLPHEKETYAPACVDACENANPGSALYKSCKLGTIEYCSTNNNIIKPMCVENVPKFEELEPVLKKWCDDNPAHKDHDTTCATPTPNTFDRQLSKLTKPVYWEIFDAMDLIIILLLCILLSALVGGRVFGYFFTSLSKIVTSTS